MKLISIIGPTASGKTKLAANIAGLLDREVISADSRQVYRGMDIGTGKDLSEYIVEGRTIPCHLIDIRDAGYRYNVFEYQRDFLEVCADMTFRGKDGVLCGGSGMYVEAVINGYRLHEVPRNEPLRQRLESKSTEELAEGLRSLKSLHNTTDTDHRKRILRAIEIEHYYREHPREEFVYPAPENIYVGMDISRETRRRRIDARLARRLDEGLVEEVQSLLEKGTTVEDMFFYGLEYKYVTLYLTGQYAYETMVKELNTAIHQFAKRQMTWFRGMERKGSKIHWIDAERPFRHQLDEALSVLGSFQK